MQPKKNGRLLKGEASLRRLPWAFKAVARSDQRVFPKAPK